MDSILAAYMIYDSPSYRSDMMVLRICVQRFGRLPQILVVDGGTDFGGINFETLLAYFHVTKKERPKAKPRHGSVIESFFGVADQEFWHNLKGNTQIMKKVRQVTKRVVHQKVVGWITMSCQVQGRSVSFARPRRRCFESAMPPDSIEITHY